MARRAQVPRVLAVCAGAALLARGATCAAAGLGPHRNVRGNPLFEDQVGECRVAGPEAVARFYIGNAGATTSFSYTVTLQQPGGRELQFWHSYAGPVVDSVACRRGGVVVFTRDGSNRASAATFAVPDIDTSYAPRPLAYVNEVPVRVRRDSVDATRPNFADWVSVVFGAGLLLAGGFVTGWGIGAFRA